MIEQQTAALASPSRNFGRCGAQRRNTEALDNGWALAKIFDCDPDEAAILVIDPKSKNLKFVIP